MVILTRFIKKMELTHTPYLLLIIIFKQILK